MEFSIPVEAYFKSAHLWKCVFIGYFLRLTAWLIPGCFSLQPCGLIFLRFIFFTQKYFSTHLVIKKSFSYQVKTYPYHLNIYNWKRVKYRLRVSIKKVLGVLFHERTQAITKSIRILDIKKLLEKDFYFNVICNFIFKIFL